MSAPTGPTSWPTSSTSSAGLHPRVRARILSTDLLRSAGAPNPDGLAEDLLTRLERDGLVITHEAPRPRRGGRR